MSGRLPIVSLDALIHIGRPRQLGFRLGGSRYGCTDTAQAVSSPRWQRFASPIRRLGGLRRSGGRLSASPMLSRSTGADMADIDFLTGSCTSTARLPAPPRRRFASTLGELDASWRHGGRLEDSPTLSPSAWIDLADIVLCLHCGQRAVLIQPSFMRLYQVGGLRRLCGGWAARGGQAVGWRVL